MKPQFVSLAILLVLVPWPFGASSAGGADGKAPDVMTVNGVQVPAPAAVPDLTDPPGAASRAPRAAVTPRPPRLGDPDAPAAVTPPARVRRAAPREGAIAAPPGSIPALLGPLPRPGWGAGVTPAEAKPAEVVTIGEPTGIDTPPAAAVRAAPATPAAPAAKPQRDVTTAEPRGVMAPAASAAKPEVKR